MFLAPIDLPIRASPWFLFFRQSASTRDGRTARTTRFWSIDHRAWDIAIPSGTEITAPHSGVVMASGDAASCGITVVVQGRLLRSRVCHLSSVTVGNGQHVGKGDLIGYSGSTGVSTGPHLHWQFSPICPGGRVDCPLVPPEKWLALSHVVTVAGLIAVAALAVRMVR